MEAPVIGGNASAPVRLCRSGEDCRAVEATCTITCRAWCHLQAEDADEHIHARRCAGILRLAPRELHGGKPTWRRECSRVRRRRQGEPPGKFSRPRHHRPCLERRSMQRQLGGAAKLQLVRPPSADWAPRRRRWLEHLLGLGGAQGEVQQPKIVTGVRCRACVIVAVWPRSRSHYVAGEPACATTVVNM